MKKCYFSCRFVQLLIAVSLFSISSFSLYADDAKSTQVEDVEQTFPETRGADSRASGVPCGGTVFWPLTPVSDVTDTNITLNDNVELPACGTHIRAETCDVLVSIMNPYYIRGANGAESQLYFEADEGQCITIQLQEDLRFEGSDSGEPLLIVFRGRGQVNFEVGDDQTLTFGQNPNAPVDSTDGATKAFVIMEDPAGGATPTVTFKRLEVESEDDIHVTLETGSLLSYAAPTCLCPTDAEAPCDATGVETGCIVFDPSVGRQNEGDDVGKLIFRIEDRAGFVVQGHKIVEPLSTECISDVDDLVCSSFDLTTPAGGRAKAKVINEIIDGQDCRLECSCMCVINNNQTLFDLLFDPWCNLGARDDTQDYNGTFSGNRYGFVIGSNGVLKLTDFTCLDYTGTACDECPEVDVPGFIKSSCIVKPRNPSALTIDGYHCPCSGVIPAEIIMGCEAGIFFKNGAQGPAQEDPCSCAVEPVDTDLACVSLEDDNFCVPSKNNLAPGAGYAVLSVEAPLVVCGSNDAEFGLECSKLEILSLKVKQSSGPLFSCPTPNPQCEGCYPKRTFDKNGLGEFSRYNKGYFFINSDLCLNNVTLCHTDENHYVFENNDIKSEPTYVGGETWVLKALEKPAMKFVNSFFRLYTNAAVTGLNVLIPNSVEPCVCSDHRVADLVLRDGRKKTRIVGDAPCCFNDSNFVFHYDGKVCDQGFGRNLILGTLVGSVACDGCTVICKDAHLDIMQTECCSEAVDPASFNHQLKLLSEASCEAVSSCMHDKGLTQADIQDQFSIHTIFLGHESNISIGSQSQEPCPCGTDVCEFGTHPTLRICGNFFSFETRGGKLGKPECAQVTGQGGIFVDCDGNLCLDPKARVSFSTMVVGSGDGNIKLPKGQVFWGPGVGIAEWMLDLNCNQVPADICEDSDNPSGVPLCEVPIIDCGECVDDYTLDWLTTKKDFDKFCPYQVGCYDLCACPPVECKNVNALPTINGTVDQLQVKGSRLGDPVHIKVSGGHVREFVYIDGNHAAEAPTSILVLEKHGRIGLGSTHRDKDSICSTSVLGVDGVSIIANGNGTVFLNEDLIIDNVCAILKGPQFQTGDKIRFFSDCCRTIRVKSTGSLDISSFDVGDVVEFGGNIKLILEPGAKVLWKGSDTNPPACPPLSPDFDGPTLRFADQACLVADPVVKIDAIPNLECPCTEGIDYGVNCLCATDEVRVKFIGRGVLELDGCSCFTIDKDAYVGVETLGGGCCPDDCAGRVLHTSLCVNIKDNAKFTIGDGCAPDGGAFQIGNSQDNVFDCNGSTASPRIDFKLDINGDEACFQIGQQGFVGLGAGVGNKADDLPNNWIVGPAFNVATINIQVNNGKFAHNQIYAGDDSHASLLALGNDVNTQYSFFCVAVPSIVEEGSQSSVLGGGNMKLVSACGNPTVLCDDDATTAMFASKLLLQPPFAGSTPAQMFDFWRTPSITDGVVSFSGVVNAGPNITRNQIRVGFVDNGQFGRSSISNIIGYTGRLDLQRQALHIGAVGLSLQNGTVLPGPCNVRNIAQAVAVDLFTG